MQNSSPRDIDLSDRFVPSLEIQANEQKVYDYALEGLRGLAALWVAYSHIFFYEFKIDPAYHPNFAFGAVLNAAHGGILIFFALSGYVIGITNQLPFSKANAIRYLLRRWIRLYPIYIIAIALGILASPTDTLRTILGNLVFLQSAAAALLSGNGVLWTLHYEIVYYLAFLGVWYFRPKIAPLVIVSLFIACIFPFIPAIPPIISGYAAGWVFWLFGLWLAWKKPRITKSVTVPLFSYLLIYISTDKLTILKVLFKDLGLTNLGIAEISITDFVYFPLCAILFAAITQRHIPYRRLLMAIAIAIPIIQIIYLLITSKLISDQNWIIAALQMLLGLALFGWRVSPDLLSRLTFIGSISYGIYVFHMPIMTLLQKVTAFSGSPITFVSRIIIWAALTIGISYLLELKLQPLIKRWFQQNVLNHVQ